MSEPASLHSYSDVLIRTQQYLKALSSCGPEFSPANLASHLREVTPQVRWTAKSVKNFIDHYKLPAGVDTASLVAVHNYAKASLSHASHLLENALPAQGLPPRVSAAIEGKDLVLTIGQGGFPPGLAINRKFIASLMRAFQQVVADHGGEMQPSAPAAQGSAFPGSQPH